MSVCLSLAGYKAVADFSVASVSKNMILTTNSVVIFAYSCVGDRPFFVFFETLSTEKSTTVLSS